MNVRRNYKIGEKMSRDIKKSLNQVLIELKNVTKRLFETNKWMYLFIMYILYLIVTAFKNSETGMVFILCLIISFISMIIYAKSKSYSETALSLILGLFTVFSTQWNSKLFVLFISFYTVFNLITFMISAISLAAKKETIILQASLKYRDNDQKNVYKQLDKIASCSSDSNQLGIIARAESIRFLSYRKLDVEYLEDALYVIEMIKTVQQCELSEALTLFYNLYTLDVIGNDNPFSKVRMIRMFDEVVVLPVSHDEFYLLFNKCKKLVLQGELTFFELMKSIKRHIYNGLDVDEINNFNFG